MLAFLFEKEVDDLRGGDHAEFARAELPRLAQDLAQDVVDHAAGGLDGAAPLAGGAGFAEHALQRFAGALARHLDQSKGRKIPDHGLDAVALQLLAQFAQHFGLVVGAGHVDEVDDDDAAQIAQPQLACNGVGCLQIGLEDGLVEIARAHVAAGVDVDGGERLGLVDDQVAAGLEVDTAPQGSRHFLVDGIEVEDGTLATVVFELLHRIGHEGEAELAQGIELLARIDADAVGVLVDHVAQHALHEAQVLVQQRGRRLPLRGLADARAGLAQVAHVLFELGIGGVLGIGAHDVAAGLVQSFFGRHAGHEPLHAFAQLLALRAGDFLRHAHGVVLRQVDHEPACDADLRGQARTLGAERVLDDLHHEGLALENLLLDGALGRGRLAPARPGGGRCRLPLAGAAALPHVGHVQESGAFEPDVDEGGLHAGQHAHDLAQIDVAHPPALELALDVHFLHHAVFDHGGTGFLGGPVDQYVLLHEKGDQAKAGADGSGTARPGAAV